MRVLGLGPGNHGSQRCSIRGSSVLQEFKGGVSGPEHPGISCPGLG